VNPPFYGLTHFCQEIHGDGRIFPLGH
jgi:hypothetical protein